MNCTNSASPAAARRASARARWTNCGASSTGHCTTAVRLQPFECVRPRSATHCKIPSMNAAARFADKRCDRTMRGAKLAHVLCRVRRRAQTYALSLNDDHGDAAEARCAGPPRSGKPEGVQAFPLEPRVQGRLARIVMAEDVFFHARIATRCRCAKPVHVTGFRIHGTRM